MPIHMVQRGETLYGIAKHYGFKSWHEIYNHPTNESFRRKRPNPNLIYPGDQIHIPTNIVGWSAPNFGDSRLTGLDGNLKLDPAIQQQMEAIESMINSDTIGNRLSLMPNSQMLLNIQLQQAITSIPRQNKPLFPRGKGPDKPRPADLSDLLKALMGIPAIKSVVDRTKEQAVDQLKNLSPNDKAIFISQSVIIGGLALSGLMADRQSRQKALEFIQDKRIPIPGVDGLSIQVNPVGKEKKFMINFDIAAFLRSMK